MLHEEAKRIWFTLFRDQIHINAVLIENPDKSGRNSKTLGNGLGVRAYPGKRHGYRICFRNGEFFGNGIAAGDRFRHLYYFSVILNRI